MKSLGTGASVVTRRSAVILKLVIDLRQDHQQVDVAVAVLVAA